MTRRSSEGNQVGQPIGDVLNRRSDLSTFLVHLTRNTPEGTSARENLTAILRDGTLRALSAMGWARDVARTLGPEAEETQKVVCFSETPLEQVFSMFADIEGRDIALQPYGVAFTKMTARRKGVNPVWYVDMTPGRTWVQAKALNQLRADAAADAAAFVGHAGSKLFPFIEPMGTWPERQREFWWEREWRHTGDMAFDRQEIALVLCPAVEMPEFETLVPGKCVDPTWSLERIIAQLVKLSPEAVTPFASR